MRKGKKMYNLKTLLKKNQFRATEVIGALVLVIGVILFGYAISAIQKREHMLNSNTLSFEYSWYTKDHLAGRETHKSHCFFL